MKLAKSKIILTIQGELCDLNRYIKALNSNRFVGNKIKKEETYRVYLECKDQKIKPLKFYPVKIKFSWYSKNKRIDIDNCSYGKKFILDGLVMAGVLEDDSRRFVKGFSDEFYIDKKNPRVVVEI